MSKTKKTVIVATLTPEELDFLSAVLMVSNYGGDPQISEKGFSITKHARPSPIVGWKGTKMTSRTIVHLWLEHACSEEATADQMEKDTWAEVKYFAKALKKYGGLPECWKEELPFLEAWRAAVPKAPAVTQ